MVVIALVDFAAAVNLTGDATVLPEAGEHTVTPTLPAAQVDDSRTNNFSKPAFFKKGTVIATEIGHAKTKNFGFDIGAFDLRKQNAASKTTTYQTDQLRIADKEQSFYAVCWWDLLPTNEKSIIKSLPPRGGKKGSSDYCQI